MGSRVERDEAEGNRDSYGDQRVRRHKWKGGIVSRDEHNTYRPCLRCTVVKVTRHEPNEVWIEYQRDGAVIARPDAMGRVRTPACEGDD